MLQVTSYKEVAEHVGLLSGSSSEEEKDNKEDEVEDITDFDQGEPEAGLSYRYGKTAIGRVADPDHFWLCKVV